MYMPSKMTLRRLGAELQFKWKKRQPERSARGSGRRIHPFSITVLFACLAIPSFGWEGDVHFCLTYWLALQAGFSREDANEIATADQSEDEGVYGPAPWQVAYAILFADQKASEGVQTYHFPSDAKPVGPPDKRQVSPGSPAARRMVEDRIKDRKKHANELNLLGEALHPLQDSWSHQGVPDTPFRPFIRIRPDYGWGHPEKRGGWPRHDADLTYLHETDLMESAEATYDSLTRFLASHPYRQKRKPVDWPSLRDSIRKFAIARTKEEKKTWLASADVNGDVIVEGLSLRGEPSDLHRLFTTPYSPARQHLELPPGLSELVNQLAESWANRQTEKLVALVDWNILKDQFAAGPGDEQVLHLERDDVIRWCKKFVNMWWVQDHGEVNAAGHCDPADKRYIELPESPQSSGPFKASQGDLQPLFRPGDLMHFPKEVLRLTNVQGDIYGTIAQVQPHDVVVLVMGEVDGQWRIVRMLWAVL